MIEIKKKNKYSMKFFIILSALLFLSSNNAFSGEKTDCSDLKKFSIKYTWCKSKNAGKAVKNKLSSLGKNKSSEDSKN